MFESLQTKLESALKVFRGQSKITEENIKEALNEVRNALLDADVNFAVVKDFIETCTKQSCWFGSQGKYPSGTNDCEIDS